MYSKENSADGLTDDQIIDFATKHDLISPQNGDIALIQFARDIESHIPRTASAILALTDERIKEVIDAIDFKKMVTADDLFYLIARAIEREVLNQQEK